jgi:hypothetical protein
MRFLTNQSVLKQFLSVLIDYITCLFCLDPCTVCVSCFQVSPVYDIWTGAYDSKSSESLRSATQDGGDAVYIKIGKTLCKSLYIIGS